MPSQTNTSQAGRSVWWATRGDEMRARLEMGARSFVLSQRTQAQSNLWVWGFLRMRDEEGSGIRSLLCFIATDAHADRSVRLGAPFEREARGRKALARVLSRQTPIGHLLTVRSAFCNLTVPLAPFPSFFLSLRFRFRYGRLARIHADKSPGLRVSPECIVH